MLILIQKSSQEARTWLISALSIREITNEHSELRVTTVN